MRKFYTIDPRLYIDKISDIYDEPKVIRVNSFNEEALEDFEEDLEKAHQTGQPIIPVVIDSYGGSCYGLLGMVAAIEAARLPVATITTSKIMSAGTLLFMWGTEGHRYMHPYAQIMIHDAASFSHGKVEEMKASTAHTDHLNQMIYKRAAKLIGKSQDYILNLIKEQGHADWYLTAKDAKSHNIANHIKVPCFDIEIGLKVSFG